MTTRYCLRCKSVMQIGYMMDRTDNARFSAEWVPGSPQKRVFLGGVKVTSSLPVVAYRCQDCGTLELVAPNPDEHEKGSLSLRQGQAPKGSVSKPEE